MKRSPLIGIVAASATSAPAIMGVATRPAQRSNSESGTHSCGGMVICAKAAGSLEGSSVPVVGCSKRLLTWSTRTCGFAALECFCAEQKRGGK